MSEQKSLSEIETNYSKSQIYSRIEKLVESGLMDTPERGKRNQYLLSADDVKTLQLLEKLEENHDTIEAAIAKLEEEEVTEEAREEENEPGILEDKQLTGEDRLQKFHQRWANQLKDGINKIRELFK